MEIKTDKGKPYPLGITKYEDGYNFSLYSRYATEATLCVFEPGKDNPTYEFKLDPKINRTGWIWHIFLKNGLSQGFRYGYKLDGPVEPIHHFDKNNILLDPFAKLADTSNKWGANSLVDQNSKPIYRPLGIIDPAMDFDWSDDVHPNLPMKDLIIYEMHVRGFTQDPSSNVTHPGTFLGMIDKIPHLKELGINAVELLPIMEFNENEYQALHPDPDLELYNYWGYSTANFFSPMNRYAVNNRETIIEFKKLVKELHKNGIEVILDVVYNHTGENARIFSFLGIDSPSYYMVEPNGDLYNFTGCGNTFNCNHAIARSLIIQSLRYWVTEMHVDGFRFDLASILLRGKDGTPLNGASIIEAIGDDPILANTKLIAEPWDAAGMYNLGGFYPASNRWSEWNGKYRDVVRKFINAQMVGKGEFATRVSGSQDYFGGRGISCNVNFVISHDGFTLNDLVSYNYKHNEDNGEGNRDGSNENDSWNCGVEGISFNKKVHMLRDRQMRNFHLALMTSQGVPMFLMGDEYGHTKFGNNNTWCQDNELNWFLWNKLEEKQGFFRFFKGLIEFRKKHGVFRRDSYCSDKDIYWHGLKPMFADWDHENKFLAFSLTDLENGNHVYVAFNAGGQSATVTFPNCDQGKSWYWVANTSHSSPDDFYEEGKRPMVREGRFKMLPHSSLILIQEASH